MPSQVLDPVLFVEARRTEQQVGGRGFAEQVCLGQRRALVRQAGFLADQHDVAFEPILAQRGRTLKGCVPGTRPPSSRRDRRRMCCPLSRASFYVEHCKSPRSITRWMAVVATT